MERLRHSPGSRDFSDSRKDEYRDTWSLRLKGALTLRLPEDKRKDFKEPKGKLFKNSELAFEYIESTKPVEIITVGDRVSATFIEAGYEPEMVIVDYSIERAPADDYLKEIVQDYSVPEVKVKNPAGSITQELWQTIKKADKPVKIVVSGEEDLATLPATLFASLGSVVVYGQPGEGLVIVKVTEEKKEEFEGYRNCLIEEK